MCPYGGLANTADASEEYEHAAMLDECRAIPSRPAIIDDSCRAPTELSTKAAHTGRLRADRVHRLDPPLNINPPALD